MKIQHTPTVAAEVWQGLLHASDDAWLYHTLSWLEMTARVWPFENRYFLAEENGVIIGSLPLQIVRRTRLGKPYHHAFSTTMGSAGPCCIRGLSPSKRQKVLHQLTEAASDWAHEARVALISCSLPPLAHNNLQNLRGVNSLTAAGWQDVSTHTRIANISRSEEELWSDLAYDARRSIKQARAAGYRVERACWPELLDNYYRVHVETYQRTGAVPHPRAYFEGIANAIAKPDHAVLWVGYEPGGKPVAFHNDARYGDGSLYWTGCCETAHLASGINYLLFWCALTGAKADGCNWYEIGESFPAAQDGKLKGLTTFKAKFGGELYRYYRGEIRVFKEPNLAPVRQLADALRQRLKPHTPS